MFNPALLANDECAAVELARPTDKDEEDAPLTLPESAPISTADASIASIITWHDPHSEAKSENLFSQARSCV